MIFRICFFQVIINKLHITQHFFFASFTGAFAKTAIINQHHIIIIAVKISCIFRPAFYASCIAMKIKNQTFWIFPVKMQAIDAYARFNIKKIFSERNIIFELKILF